MEITVSGHQMDVGEALRSRIVNELSERVEKYFDRGGSAEVRLNPDGHGYRADISLYLASGQFLVSHGVGGDAHAPWPRGVVRLARDVWPSLTPSRGERV